MRKQLVVDQLRRDQCELHSIRSVRRCAVTAV